MSEKDNTDVFKEYLRGRPEYPSWSEAPWSGGRLDVPLDDILGHVYKTVVTLQGPESISEEHQTHEDVITALFDVLWLITSHPDKDSLELPTEWVNLVFNLGRLVGESTLRTEDSPMFLEPRKRLVARQSSRRGAENTNAKKRDRYAPMREVALSEAKSLWDKDSEQKLRTGDVVNQVHTKLAKKFAKEGREQAVTTRTIRSWLSAEPDLVPAYAKKRGINRLK